jgi:hypothetical protein
MAPERGWEATRVGWLDLAPGSCSCSIWRVMTLWEGWLGCGRMARSGQRVRSAVVLPAGGSCWSFFQCWCIRLPAGSGGVHC